MLPMLKLQEDGREHETREITDILALRFELSPEERDQRTAGGTQTVIHNRGSWARVFLKRAGLIAATRRGVFCLTDRG
jgi:restriction system protein